MSSSNKILVACYGYGGIKAHHALRPWHLAKFLSQQDFSIEFLGSGKYLNKLINAEYVIHKVSDVSLKKLEKSVKQYGVAKYPYETLKLMVAQEIEVLQKIQPKLILSDYRRSLSISARVCNTPLVTINNSSWTKYSILSNWSSTKATETILLDPFNKLRNYYGLPQIGSIDDELEGDYSLWADVPEFSPVREAHSNHHFVGPFFWEESLDSPSFADFIDKPVIVLDFGVNFDNPTAELIRYICKRSGVITIEIVHSSLNFNTNLSRINKHYFQVDFCLAGDVIPLGKLVVTDGNLETVYRCIAHKVPIVGIAFGGEEDLYINRLGVLDIAKIYTRHTINELTNNLLSPKLIQEFIRHDVTESYMPVDNNACILSKRLIDSLVNK